MLSTSSSTDSEDFKASKSWLQRFKNRTGIHSVVRYRGASGDKVVAERFVKEF